jgi:hypothetical protein
VDNDFGRANSQSSATLFYDHIVNYAIVQCIANEDIIAVVFHLYIVCVLAIALIHAITDDGTVYPFKYYIGAVVFHADILRLYEHYCSCAIANMRIVILPE